MARRKKRGDELFNNQGFRHYRRRYNINELWWGLFVFAVLCCTGAWVAYKGAHPDPELFKDGSKLLKLAKKRIKVIERRPHNTSLRQGDSAPTARRKAGPGDKLLPPSLAGKEWEKKPTSHFTANTLYEKINGRAGYYRSFGCKQMFFTTLLHPKTQKSIDIELYDMGKSVNALGAYAGEMTAKATPEVGQRGMSHTSRNALYVSRGPYYARLIGSDESPTIKAKLKALKAFFKKQIKGDPLPWAYGLLVSVSIKASAISYARENAFSFGFAKDVYTGKIGKNTYAFVNAQSTQAEAKSLAQKFRKGWLSYGSLEKDGKAIDWVKDRFIGTYATAIAAERWVIGVQGATDRKKARTMLLRLKQAVAQMPASLRKRAVPGVRKKKAPVRAKPAPRPRPVPPMSPEEMYNQKKPVRRTPPQPREGGYDATDGYGNPRPAARRRAAPAVRRAPASRPSRPSRPKPRTYESGIDER